MREAITFDDVLLEPQYSDIESRSEVDIGSALGTFKEVSVAYDSLVPSTYKVNVAEREVICKLPIISSPMDTVTEDDMALAMCRAGGFGIIHRYNTVDEQVAIVLAAQIEAREKKEEVILAAAIGATGDYMERAKELVNAGATVLCVDTAHGHHSHMKTACANIKQEFNSVHLMAGNVATLTAFRDLENWGADSIRVGIGGGSICSTRLRTGHGVPTLQSVFDCAAVARNAKIIADGGIKTSGDIVKALAAGADFVMLGSMLAGTDEAPGEIIERDNKLFKEYRGMASKEAQVDWRGYCSVSEGVSTVVPYKGSVLDVLKEAEAGMRSGLSYSGVRDLKELYARARFIKQTQCGQVESGTHILKE